MNHRRYFFCGLLWGIIAIFSLLFVVPVSAQMVGGYSDASVTDPGVIAAAKFAVSEQAKKDPDSGGPGILKLEEILSARQQVVAGLNYDLQLKVKVRNEEKIAQAIVYRNLQGTHQLTSWVWK